MQIASGTRAQRGSESGVVGLRTHDDFAVNLLDGVTGSGKTEVYLRRMQDVIDRGQQVLVLVPEIGLTPQLVGRLRRRLGIEPALLHSGLTTAGGSHRGELHVPVPPALSLARVRRFSHH